MLDIKFIRANLQAVEDNAAKKKIAVDVPAILKLDAEVREAIRQGESLRAQQKASSKGKPGPQTIKNLRDLSAQTQTLRQRRRELESQLEQQLRLLPAMALPDVPVGNDERDNVVVRQHGNPPCFDFDALDYLQIAARHDLVDVERAAKVSGARFGYLKNEAAQLEFALVRYALDTLVGDQHFTFMVPPVMIGQSAMQAMGYLEHGGEDETYHFERDALYLVGTSEQSVGPYHRDEVLPLEKLPLRYCAFSTCFRREAGAAGKDTRGILRVHQFDKIEMFIFCRPKDSPAEHERLLSIEEKLLSGLGLPYRVVQCCTGELGLPAAKKYDLETWIPSQGRYRETHSTSNCTDFQARRLNIRYRDPETGRLEYVHTLNGTAFAVGRTVIALLENFQQRDGSVAIPSVLQPYLVSHPKRIG